MIFAALILAQTATCPGALRPTGTSGLSFTTFIGRKRADRLDREASDRSNRDRPPLAREERVQTILSQRVHTRYTDRNKTYSLRDSEIHTLSEVGKFRVVATRDLAEFAYNGDRARVKNDVENLVRQGLMKEATIADPEHNPTQVVTLTKEGHKLLSRGKVLPSDPAN